MAVTFRQRGCGGGPRMGRPLGCVWAAGMDAGAGGGGGGCVPSSCGSQCLHEGMPRVGLEEGLGAPGPAAAPEDGGLGRRAPGRRPLWDPPSFTAPCSPPPLPSRQRSRRLEATGSQGLLPARSSVLPSRCGLRVSPGRLGWLSGAPSGRVCVMLQGCHFQ